MKIELTSGDRLVLHRDGLAEVFNRHQDMLGVEGLAQLVLDSANFVLPEMRHVILEGVTAWRHGPFDDDVSLVIVESLAPQNFDFEHTTIAVSLRLAKLSPSATRMNCRLFVKVGEAVPAGRPPGAVPGGQILLKVLIAKGEVMTATVFRFSRPENPEA